MWLLFDRLTAPERGSYAPSKEFFNQQKIKIWKTMKIQILINC